MEGPKRCLHPVMESRSLQLCTERAAFFVFVKSVA